MDTSSNGRGTAIAPQGTNGNGAAKRPEEVRRISAAGVFVKLKVWASGEHFLELSQKDHKDEWQQVTVQVADASGLCEAISRLKQLAILREDQADARQ